MKIVRLLGHSSGEPIVIGVIKFNKGKVDLSEVPAPLKKEMEKYGIVVQDKKLFPDDGMEFMEGLKFNYTGSSLRATGVMKFVE